MNAADAPSAQSRYAPGSALCILTEAFGSDIPWVWTAKPRRGAYPLVTKGPIRRSLQTWAVVLGFVMLQVAQALESHPESVIARTLGSLMIVAATMVVCGVLSAIYQRAYTAYGFDGRRAFIARGGVFPSAAYRTVADYTIIGKRRADGSGSVRFEEPERPRRWFGPQRIAYAFVDVPNVDEIATLLATACRTA